MMVNMPVEVANENCSHCPELDLDIYTTETFGTIIDENGNPVEIKNFNNVIRCKSCAKCKFLLDNILNKEEPKEEKPVKKTATRKKAPAKTATVSRKKKTV